MTAATILTQTSNIMSVPGIEVVQLEISTGETYTAKTLSRVDCFQATFNEDVSAVTAVPSGTVSSGVFTLTSGTITDKKLCLTLYGA